MFSKDQEDLIAAQNNSLVAQSETIRAQADTITALNIRLEKDDQERRAHLRTIEERDQRIAQLEAYFKDLGINLPVIDGAPMWWSLAKKAIAVKVEPHQINGDQSFANDHQKAFAVQIATAAVSQD